MTNREIMREVRKPGRIEMPVLAGADVVHLIVEKSDLLGQLERGAPDDECVWALTGQPCGGVRRLDVA